MNDLVNMRTKVSPVQHAKTMRPHDLRCMTSIPAGKMTPLAYIPLLREDSVQTGRFRTQVELQETAELLMNSVHLSVSAYLVPNLAFDRFDGMDELNKSYSGQNSIPFVQRIPYLTGAGDVREVFKYLGIHAKDDDTVNLAVLEAYNQIWNFRARNRSPKITERALGTSTLAPAFWKHNNMNHIVPDFDQAVIDVELSNQT